MVRTKTLVVNALALVLALISGLSDAGSANSSKQKQISLLKPDESTAVVSFIRRSVLMGDGWNYDVWDGDQYVGVLGSGHLLQYRSAPGEHVFLLMVRGVHAWTYMKANLIVGKEYFARAYPLPFSLQAVDSNSDERVDTWASMKIDKPLTEKERNKAIKKFGAEMHGALAAYRANEIAADCAVWVPPKRSGEKSTQPKRSSGGCRSIGDMKPEQGR